MWLKVWPTVADEEVRNVVQAIAGQVQLDEFAKMLEKVFRKLTQKVAA
jgi:hypothetical protein